MFPLYIMVHMAGNKSLGESDIGIALNLGSVCYYYINNDSTVTFALFNGERVKTVETSDKIMDMMNESSTCSLYNATASYGN